MVHLKQKILFGSKTGPLEAKDCPVKVNKIPFQNQKGPFGVDKGRFGVKLSIGTKRERRSKGPALPKRARLAFGWGQKTCWTPFRAFGRGRGPVAPPPMHPPLSEVGKMLHIAGQVSQKKKHLHWKVKAGRVFSIVPMVSDTLSSMVHEKINFKCFQGLLNAHLR